MDQSAGTRSILHVVRSVDGSMAGLARAVIEIANIQVAGGDLVTIAATHAGQPPSADELGLDQRVHLEAFALSGPAGRLGHSRSMRTWLQKNLPRADVVFAHAIWDLPAYFAAQLARSSSVPLVISPHGSLDPADLRKHLTAKKILGPLFVRPNLADATVWFSSAVEQERSDLFGATPKAVALAPLAPGTTTPPSLSSLEFRDRYGIANDVPVLLFVGRFNPAKGIPLLLEALQRLDESCRLVVVGSGDTEYTDELRALAQALGVHQRVAWPGWLDGGEKSSAYAASDLVVVPSDSENFGFVVVEALQHGKPVLASPSVGAAQVLGGEAPITTCSPDPAAWAREIHRLLGASVDEEEATRQRARQALERTLSPDALANTYKEIVVMSESARSTVSPHIHGSGQRAHRNQITALPRQLARRSALSLLGPFSRPAPGIHILGGHHMGHHTTMSVERFDQQLAALHEVADFARIEDAVAMVQAGERPARPTIAFTFDDSFAEWTTHIAPALERHGVNAAFFVNPHLIDVDPSALGDFQARIGGISNKRPATRADIVDLVARGHVIGAHTLDHASLRTEDPREIERQIDGCKAKVERISGTDCSWFAWTYGGFQHISRPALDAALASYELVFSLSGSPHYRSIDNRLLNRRHFEPFWRASDVRYFTRRRRLESLGQEPLWADQAQGID